MARSRGRSRGSSLPALGGTLGSLVRSTLAQAGVVRDALERGAREGKQRLDDARRERRREQALARLGEAVLELLRAGELPELLDRDDVADAIGELDELERGEERGRRDDAWVAPPTRERYDRGGDDDGTVSSASWRPPTRPRVDERGQRGERERGDRGERGRPVWRPTEAAGAHGDDHEAGHAGERRPADEPGARFAERRPADEPGARFAERRPADAPGARSGSGERRAPDERDRAGRRPREDEPAARPIERRRAGGIQFDHDDDEDLAEYMHPDDLAPGPTKGS